MAKDFIKTWDGRRLEDWGSVVSKEFKSFQQAMKREVKRLAEEEGVSLAYWSNGHYDMTGVLERDGLFVYFSYSNLDRTNVVLTPKGGWHNCVLMRTMKHAKDWTGGSNNNIEFSQFTETMKRLFREQEAIRDKENSSINNQNNNETMAKNLKAADLIGKVIIVGDNIATITVKSVEGETLKCEFKNGDRPAVPMPISIEQVESNIKVGIWKLEGAAETATESATATSEEPIAQAEAASEDDVQEVEDIEPAKPEEPIAEEEPAKAKTVKMESAKPKKSDKKSEAKPTAETGGESAGTLKYTTYTTSKGKTGAKITGLKETDAAYQQAGEIHGSASWENKNGKKLYYIAFGPKYAEAAKSICQVLNADKTDEQKLAECKVIIASADQERAERKEASKAKRETWKAEHPDGKAEKPAKETKGKASTTKGEKTYTQKELAEWLRKLNAGDPKAAEFFENIAKAA